MVLCYIVLILLIDHDTFLTANERVYLILKTTVHLSHPGTMDLVLRKHLSINIYKRQSITDRIRQKIVKSDCLTQCGVTYEVVSNILKVCIFLFIANSKEQIINLVLK